MVKNTLERKDEKMTEAATDALQHDKDDAARVVEAVASKHSRQDVQTNMEQQAPLQIQEKGVNMQDFRNILLKTVRSKIEIRNIFKLKDDRLAKMFFLATFCTWRVESVPKLPGQNGKTILHW